MTYQDLIEELQAYSPEELKQEISFLSCDDFELKCDDVIWVGDEIENITCFDGDQIRIMF